jgi:hypothetical protein
LRGHLSLPGREIDEEIAGQCAIGAVVGVLKVGRYSEREDLSLAR